MLGQTSGLKLQLGLKSELRLASWLRLKLALMRYFAAGAMFHLTHADPVPWRVYFFLIEAIKKKSDVC